MYFLLSACRSNNPLCTIKQTIIASDMIAGYLIMLQVANSQKNYRKLDSEWEQEYKSIN